MDKIVEEGIEVIKKGVVNGITKEVVKYAERFGTHLGRDLGKDKKLSTSQIRNIYSAVKRMEMKGYNESEFLLLKPKLAYVAKRGKKGAEDFKEVFVHGIDVIVNLEDKKNAFKNFCKFFEAVLAYHRAAGGD